MVAEPLTENTVKSQDSIQSHTNGDTSKKLQNKNKFGKIVENIFLHILAIFLFTYVIYGLSLLVSISISIIGGIIVKFLIFSFRSKRQRATVKIVKVRKFLVPNDSLETILETMKQDLVFQLDNESEHFWIIKQE